MSTIDLVIVGVLALSSGYLFVVGTIGLFHARRLMRERIQPLCEVEGGDVLVTGVVRATGPTLRSLGGEACVTREVEVHLSARDDDGPTRYAGIDRRAVEATLEEGGVTCALDLAHVHTVASRSFELKVSRWKKVDPETVAQLLENPERDSDRVASIVERVIFDGATVTLRAKARGQFRPTASYREKSDPPALFGTNAEPIVVVTGSKPISAWRRFAPSLVTLVAAAGLAGLAAFLFLSAARLDAATRSEDASKLAP